MSRVSVVELWMGGVWICASAIDRLNERYGKNAYVFQEDGASPHRAKSTRVFLSDKVLSSITGLVTLAGLVPRSVPDREYVGSVKAENEPGGDPNSRPAVRRSKESLGN